MEIMLKHSLSQASNAKDDIAREQKQLSININTELPIENNVVGVFGKSGAGKSNILKVIAGLYRDAQFSFNWHGQYVSHTENTNNPCVYVGEDTLLFEHLSVADNLNIVKAYSSVPNTIKGLKKLDKAQIIERCKIKHLLSHSVSQLSSGEKQRVNFARALLTHKQILLLDEAFSALDWQTRSHMQNMLLDLVHHHGYYCVLVSHSLRELGICCQYLWQIEDADLKRQGDVQTVLSDVMSSDLNTQHHSSAYFSIIEAQFIASDSSDNSLQLWQLADSAKNGAHIYIKAMSTEASNISNNERENAQAPSSQNFIINADAVSISVNEPQHSSMLNKLKSKITNISKTQSGALISLLVGSQTIRSLITHKSFLLLNLKEGDEVYAVFKALDKQSQD